MSEIKATENFYDYDTFFSCNCTALPALTCPRLPLLVCLFFLLITDYV